jgi:hypothetical protein
MSWLDNAVAQSSAPLTVDISSLGILDDDGNLTETIEVVPVSAKEYQVLKHHEHVRNAPEADREERLGMVVTFEMMKKADSSLKWDSFRNLPIQFLNRLATLINAAMGKQTSTEVGDGDGLGEL